ncbi:uncharacterized protein VTP21DRAFT_4761 [Calcarisporiella thermophila]|uniref:uncharacterized protein n=1 Tax=Calcarisporiella thermophila TaxID=911321 RepID=UPI00374449C1
MASQQQDSKEVNPLRPQHHYVIIIGAGFSGLGTAIRLMQENIHDFVILERGNDVGGTWRDNSYPGAACDVQSDLYSFSFAQNPDWTRNYAPQPEIFAYLRWCASKYDVYKHCRFYHEVEYAQWDDARQLWEVQTSQGTYSGNFVVSGAGALCEPSYPKIKGLAEFAKVAGNSVFHSARWDHERDLSGRKVAVIGTGASAIQIIPAIQPKVKQLVVLQRTPPWVIPRDDRPRFERWLFRRIPILQTAMRAFLYIVRELFVIPMKYNLTAFRLLGLLQLYWQVKDPKLRARITPSYSMGCKRILISNDYYPAITQPNVSVVTEGIEEIEENHIVTRDGARHGVDTIVLATGFLVTDAPTPNFIRGRGGKLLAEAWRENIEAYKGTTIPGFPNSFILLGPNTGLGHTSQIVMIEAQINYIVEAIKYMRDHSQRTIEVKRDACREYNEMIARKLRNTVWTSGGCKSWYQDSSGKNPVVWPDYTFVYWWKTRRFDFENFIFT